MSHHIVEVKNLRFTYPDGTAALQSISFRINHGESVALVGANGAGKSTLLLHLNGYLSPSEGTVRIGDLPLNKDTLKDVRKTVGMVFQDSDDQLFMSKVYDDVAFGPLNLGLPSEEVNSRVIAALKKVDVEHLKNRPPYKLSGGQKKRAAIASVLSMNPSILVMDEPTAGLDPRSRRQLINLLHGFEHTKIIATHDLDMVTDLCDRTIIIHDGKVLGDGSTSDIFSDMELLNAGHLERPLRMQSCPICSKTTSKINVNKCQTAELQN